MNAKKDGYSVELGVDISEIDPELRPASQMRVKLDEEAVHSYADTFDSMPPVLLMHDPTTGLHWVVDGCHTIHAAKTLGRSEIQAKVKPGTYLDAFSEASRANSAHGVRVTNADKRHRIEVALKHPEMARWSNRRIAEACSVTDPTVGKLRPEPCAKDSHTPATRIDTTGRKQPATKPKKPESKVPTGANGSATEEPSKATPTPSPASSTSTSTPVDPPCDPVAIAVSSPPAVAPMPVASPEVEPSCQATDDTPSGDDETTDCGAIDWHALWADEERRIIASYEAWPEFARSFFVERLLWLAHSLHESHPDVIFQTDVAID